MASGSWDAQSIFETCNKFDVGVMNFPLPAPGETVDGEDYAQFGILPYNEAGTVGGGSFGITKTARHPEVALDFLRFLTSHKWNQRLNVKAGWLPVTIGAVPKPAMQPFMPNPYGVAADVGFAEGFDLETKIKQSVDKYLGGEEKYDYEKFSAEINASMADSAIGIDQIWKKNLEKINDNVRSLERTIAIQGFRELAGTGTPMTAQRMRETILDQSIYNDGANVKLLYERLNHRPLQAERDTSADAPFHWLRVGLAILGQIVLMMAAFPIIHRLARRPAKVAP
jgi:hypothetical protein